jgi:spore maturation protein CgeB
MAIKDDPKLSCFRVGEARVPCADLILNIEPCAKIISYPTAVTCFLEIDNHIHQGRDLEKYNAVDHVFVTQKHFIDLYPKEKTTWLPLAADPEKHRLYPEEKILYDVGFLGNHTYPERSALLKQIAGKYKLLQSTAKPGEEYSRLLSRCKLIFNRSMDNDMNMRVFEGMSIGRPLLSDIVDGQNELFSPDEHYISYEKWEDLDGKIEWLLKNPEYCEKIGNAGAALIRAKHTYRHRLEKILQVCGFY